MRYLILIILIIILGTLVSALFALVKGDSSDRMLKSLTWRIGLSALLLFLLAVGATLGLIEPHPPGF